MDGTSGRIRLAGITEEPLSVEACVAAVSGSQVGGLGLFVGTVRDRDHGRDVVSLSYEAHPSAAAELRAVCERALARDVLFVAAVHRIGELTVGDLAVVIAVGAQHRGEALEVTRWLIDTIKSEVPIWKHQFFGDGTDEWVGACE